MMVSCRPVRLLAAVSLCAALTVTAVVAQSASRQPLNPTVTVKAGAVGALSDAGIFIALEKGYFKDEGIDVDLVTFKAGPQIIPSLATGQVQVTGTSVSPSLLNAVQRNVGMKIVADKGQVTKGHGWAAIMVRKDLADTIKDFKDLKGRKIGLPSKGVSVYTQLGRALSLGGLTINDADIIQVGFANMTAALANKAIDVAMLIEPFTTLVVQRGLAVRWKGIDEYYPFNAQNGVLMYGENFTKEQPEAAKRWMIAYLRGVRTYEDAVSKGIDRDAIFGILAKHTAVKNIKLYSKMRPIYFDPNGRVEVRSIELDQDWFLKLGLELKRVDLSKLIDYQYIDYATAQLKKH